MKKDFANSLLNKNNKRYIYIYIYSVNNCSLPHWDINEVESPIHRQWTPLQFVVLFQIFEN